jgi:DNA-directed RNA polymerase subunit M/transcription elongation factor TFIIS
MHFCPDCESYLITKIINNDNPNKILNLECNNCGYKKNIDISKEPKYKCIYQNNFKNKKIKIDQKNIQYLDKDPTLPHVNNIPCPNPLCITKKETHNPDILTDTTPKVLNDVLYLKLNDNNLTFLYQCCNCKHTWTNK